MIFFLPQELGFDSCLVLGRLIYSSVLGIDMVIINSETVARELLEKRSVIYSDRPVIPTNDLYVAPVIELSVSSSYLDDAELERTSVLYSFRMARLCNDTARLSIKS